MADIFLRMFDIIAAIGSNPLVYLPIIGSWFITAIYFIVNPTDNRGFTYVMSTGIAHIFTAYAVSPFAKYGVYWDFGDMRTIVVLALFTYGLFLILMGMMHEFPNWLAEFFGDPSHALVPSLMAVLFVENQIPFDWTTAIIVAFFPVILYSISIYRRVQG